MVALDRTETRLPSAKTQRFVEFLRERLGQSAKPMRSELDSGHFSFRPQENLRISL